MKIWKHVLVVLLAMLLFLPSSPSVVLASEEEGEEPAVEQETDDPTSGLNWELLDDGTLVISGNEPIPDYSYSNRAPWDDDRQNIRSIIIEDGVTGIGDFAIYECNNLESIVIPDSVTYLGMNSISFCEKLSRIDLPESIESIESHALTDNTNLTDVNIPEHFTSLPAGLFSMCTSLESIKLPDGLTEIGGGVFYGCTGLTSIDIPEGVTTIGVQAFTDCTSLVDIELPEGITEIPSGMFAGCSSLSDIVIPEGVNNIGSSAFNRCTSLTSIVIPEGNKDIKRWTFYGCTSLKNVTVPTSVTLIVEHAFDGCDSLRSIYYPGSPEDWQSVTIEGYNDSLDHAAIQTYYGKKFSEPEYEWQENEDGSYVVGIMVCEEDPDIVITETVPVVVETIENTCEQDGEIRYIAAFKDDRFEQQMKTEVIPATGHLHTEVRNQSDATCTTDGWTGDLYCIDCGSVLEQGSVIEALGHDLEHVEAKDPMPRADGNIEYWHCSRCSKYYSDADATIEITKEDTLIPGLVDIALAEVDTPPSVTYTGQEFTPVPVVVYQGKVLQLNEDYTLSYIGNLNAGEAMVTITGQNHYFGTKNLYFSIDPVEAKPTVTLSATAVTYNGKVQNPTVTVKVNGKKLTTADYTVKYASGCKNVGKYKVTVTLKRNYSGSKSETFQINPKGTTLATSTAASKAITVKWKKQATKMAASTVSGYQIQLATDSKFTKNKKTVTVSGYSNTSKKVTKLKGKTKYYIRIRTYKTVSGTKYYSPWSKAKTVTTKA